MRRRTAWTCCFLPLRRPGHHAVAARRRGARQFRRRLRLFPGQVARPPLLRMRARHRPPHRPLLRRSGRRRVGGGDPVVSIDGVEATNVWVMGRVVSVVNMEAGVSFTLDDGTGKIAVVRWITDQMDVKEAAFVQNGVYLKVQVTHRFSS